MRNNLKELEESIRILEEFRKEGKNSELAADVESGILAVEGVMESTTSGIRHSIDRKVREMESAISALRKDVESMKSSMEAAAKIYHGGNDAESPKIAGKNYMEMKSRMDVLQKYVDGKLGSIDRIIEDSARKFAGSQKDITSDVNRLNELSKRLDSVRNDTSRTVSEAVKNVPKRDEIRKDIEEKISGKLAEFSRKIDEISKTASVKTAPASGADRNIEENLKMFALNSDVEKVWKETESLKRYVDEKTKMADSLANSLRVWESRNMQVMEKEHDFDEKLGAFPELKLLESRIRRMERALVELQRHFVAAQITEPIIME